MPRKSDTPTPAAASPQKVVSPPKVGATVPAKTKYNPIGHLGDYAHPPKKGKKK